MSAAGIGARGLIAAAALLAAAAAGGSPREHPSVEVATTGNGSEVAKTIPVTRRAGASPRVALSMGPGTLPGLERGDRLRVTAELQVTNDCNYRSPRCIGPVYHHNPEVRANLIVASSPRATGGRGTRRLAATQRVTCTQRRPDFKHHCVLVFTHGKLTIGGALPCSLDRCYVNVVADASNPHAKRGEVIAIGGLAPNGSIPQDRGRINVVRIRDATASDFQRLSTDHRHRRHVRPDLHRRVLYSQRIDDLRAGDQLAVAARMRTDISRLRYAVRTSARLILADSPTAVRQGNFVRHHALYRGEIAENNGSNCTQAEGTCVYPKVGVMEMRRDCIDGRGRPVPLYVNLVTVFGPKARKARAGDRVSIRRRGGIEVTRYPAALNR